MLKGFAVIGKIDSITQVDKKEYDGKITEAHDVLEFFDNTGKRLTVKSLKCFSVGKYLVGDDVALAVEVGTYIMNGKASIWYKIVGDLDLEDI